MVKKSAHSNVQLPPSMMRLAAVLAEIAQNEATSAPTVESLGAIIDIAKQENRNSYKEFKRISHP